MACVALLAGAAARAAAAGLARDGVAEDDFKRERLRGGARRLAVRAEGLDVALDEGAKTLTASFQLPAGAYATTMLGELFGALDVVHENRGKHAGDDAPAEAPGVAADSERPSEAPVAETEVAVSRDA